MFLTSGGKYSKSLSPRYKARSVSTSKSDKDLAQQVSSHSTVLPSLKKFPGKTFSFKLLYDKSNTSRTGKAPKPLKLNLCSMSPTAANKIVTHRGSELSRLMEQLRILSFGIADSDSGSSSRWLLDKLRISKLLRLAMAAGNTEISIKY